MRRRLVAGCEEGVGLRDELRVTMSAASCPIAIASFGGDGLETVHGIDVTMLVTFAVDNTSVAHAHGNLISPRGSGVAAVVVDSYRGRSVQGGGLPSAGALVRVDHEPVKAEAIVALIVSEASWADPGVPSLAPGSGVGRDAFGAFTATAALSYRLVAELDVANMYLWTVFNDSTRIPLAHADALGARVRSLRPSDIGLVHSSLVTCTSSADPRTNFEISWSLWCDDSLVTQGGANYHQAVAVPRQSTHAASRCTLTLEDNGAVDLRLLILQQLRHVEDRVSQHVRHRVAPRVLPELLPIDQEHELALGRPCGKVADHAHDVVLRAAKVETPVAPLGEPVVLALELGKQSVQRHVAGGEDADRTNIFGAPSRRRASRRPGFG